MIKFKIIRTDIDQYIIEKRNFFYQYKLFVCEDGYGFYESVDECITHIHKEYYSDECDIKIVDLTKEELL